MEVHSVETPEIIIRPIRGRPRSNKSIKFSPEPKSIVSQILKKMITKNRICIPIVENNFEDSSDPIIIDDEIIHDTITIEDSNESNFAVQEPKKKSPETKPKTYYCDYSNCAYNTKLSSNLQKHKRVHTGEKPYLCDRCSFRTNFSNSLKVHKRLHTEERPYQCSLCDYRCNSISNLKKHCHTKHKGNTIEFGVKQ